MSWDSTYSPLHPNSDDETDVRIDRLARQLATQAGQNWDGMNNFPGFERNRWRETAERTLAEARKT